jgi:hypothetical protein
MNPLKEDYQDIVQALGLAALSASGFGAAGPIWDLFFSGGDENFTDDEIQQMTTIFQTVLLNQDYESWLADYQTAATQLGQYVNNPIEAELLASSNSLLLTANKILNIGGFGGTKLYLSTYSLYILSLKYIAELTNPILPGALENIGEAALQGLTNLASLQTDMLQSFIDPNSGIDGVAAIASFQQFLYFGGPVCPPWGDIVGSNYVTNIALLIQTVIDYTPASVSDIPGTPKALLSVFNFDPSIQNQYWVCAVENAPVGFYKCQTINQNGLTFLPVSDIVAEGNEDEGSINTPPLVAYIAGYPPTDGSAGERSFLAHNDSPGSFPLFQYATDAHSGVSPDLSIWYVPLVVANGKAYSPASAYVGNGNSTLETPARIFVIEQSYLTQIEGTIAISFNWDGNGWSVTQDPAFYNYSTFQCHPTYSFNTNLFSGIPATSYPIYRWVNAQNHAHCFTADTNYQQAGFSLEGRQFALLNPNPIVAPLTTGTVPLYSWFDPNTGAYFYCTDPSGELAPENGFVSQGVLGHISPTQTTGTTSLYRWSRSSPFLDHYYTIDANDQYPGSNGYDFELITGYVLP